MGYAGRSEPGIVIDFPSDRERRQREEARRAFAARFEYIPELGWVGGPGPEYGSPLLAVGILALGAFAVGWYVGTGIWWAATLAFFGGGR